MNLLASDITALWLTLQLAAVTTVILMVIGAPLAWWLSRSTSKFSSVVEATVALPLILPPTVIGFYLLIAFSPDNFLGSSWLALTGQPLAFTFSGLVVGSVIYSLPFVVQPLQSGFQHFDHKLLEAAETMGAGTLDRFFNLIIPLTRRAFVTAALLGFAHTMGEFGVVLMIGGNIPGETQVLSIALYDHVEALDYQRAHWLAGGLLAFSFALLILLYGFNRHKKSGVKQL
ncbi:MAG: molybdate ABC transporter permease subunit [Porticoccus sp.]|nr:molybdate ABC transporter permease subunit [Porticoccus sp.]MBQ0807885.1 molybdate ABC transporter permease subunit [Porticoccus sp.]